ncbi:MAG: YhgE/Pip domain-containing protein [Clostridium sp.]|nr:YhgE/Pip domain-containing protein [Clostridium sp.]
MNHIFNVLNIFKMDIKKIIKNPITFIIIGGICILPSLYAWVNIKACWDPYANTGTIPVAVVNNDKSVSFKGKNINIGSNIVKKLKKNKSIGWHFVTSKEADLGIVDGTYYAVIQIPDDFSSDFLSVLSNKPKKPNIIYKVDTKVNPVAGKITDVAKDTLTDEITSNFISTVNETIFSSLNTFGNDADKNKSDLINLKNSIIKINNNMDYITSALQSINGNSNNLSAFLTQIKATMPTVNSGLSQLLVSNENNASIIKSTQSTLNDSLNNIQLNLNNAQATVYRIQGLNSTLSNSAANANSSQIYYTTAQLNMNLDALSNSINALTNYLTTINNTNPNKNVADMIISLKSIQNSITDEKSNVTSLSQKFSSTNDLNKNILNSINNDTSNINTTLINATTEYNSKTKNSMNTISNNYISATNDASALIKNAQDLNNQIDNLIGTSIDGSTLASKTSGDLNTRLLQFKDTIKNLGDKFEMVDNNDLAQIISILQSNPKFMGDFISNPFNIVDQSIYQIPNYGSAMSPVYTVLAIWVGDIILAALLKTDITYFKGAEKFHILERHFGKMLTFIFLNLIQSFIVIVGDKVILHVYSVNTPLLIIFALASGITFTIIVFTLTSLLGNIGKALSIIFLIVQIAGSGATYPIQVDPLFFRIFQPLFPFTYAVGGFREAIAGPLISSVVLDFTMLFIISLVFTLLGIFLKTPLHKPMHKFSEKFKEAGISE